MKKIESLWIFVLLIAFVATMFISCKKDESSSSTKEKGILFNKDIIYGTMSDQEGNVYKTIQIGTQTWMAENLRTTKYRNGQNILNITDNKIWANNYSSAYCWQNNDSATNKATYGALYNDIAIFDKRNIAPIGWHIPSADEWVTLTYFVCEKYQGGNYSGTIAGGVMKESGSIHWFNNNYESNESGFTALPAGSRDGSGFFSQIGIEAYFWTSTKETIPVDGVYDLPLFRILYWDNARCDGKHQSRFSASVRCVKD